MVQHCELIFNVLKLVIDINKVRAGFWDSREAIRSEPFESLGYPTRSQTSLGRGHLFAEVIDVGFFRLLALICRLGHFPYTFPLFGNHASQVSLLEVLAYFLEDTYVFSPSQTYWKLLSQLTCIGTGPMGLFYCCWYAWFWSMMVPVNNQLYLIQYNSTIMKLDFPCFLRTFNYLCQSL